jgi:hypothetical protein
LYERKRENRQLIQAVTDYGLSVVGFTAKRVPGCTREFAMVKKIFLHKDKVVGIEPLSGSGLRFEAGASFA